MEITRVNASFFTVTSKAGNSTEFYSPFVAKHELRNEKYVQINFVDKNVTYKNQEYPLFETYNDFVKFEKENEKVCETLKAQINA